MTDLTFSTIRTKGPSATNPQTSDRLLKMSQVFQRNLNASSPNKPTMNASTDLRMLSSDRLIYSEKQDAIPVVIGKKAKKSGKTLFRQGQISRRDIFKFGQTVHNKQFPTPLDFVGETRDEFMTTSTAATKAEKKTLLAWEAKEIASLNYRIRFRRYNPEQEGPSDTAFYFERQEEWKKMMNFLKGIKLLETNAGNFSNLLKNLSERFRDNAIKKFRDAINARAVAIKQSAVQKDVLIKQNILINQFNLRLLKDLTAQWKSIALIRDKDNKKSEQERLARKAALEGAANKSALLANINNRLMTIMSEAWNNKALEKAIPSKEDINILFNTLELPPSITSPSVRLEVKLLQTLPDVLRVNGRLLQNNSRVFTLSCLQKPSPGTPKDTLRYWGIVAGSGDISEEQKKFVRESYAPSTVNLEGEKFSLHFEDFPLEHLENVEINVSILDENRKMKAYHYSSLKGLQLASKKGKNAWLCLSTNEQANGKLPLLHLKVETRVARNIQERKQLAGRAANFAKFANTNVIEDTFYNYSFRVPNVTPERAGLLELLPATWGIMDSRTRDLNRSQANRAEFIQRVKYKLSKHYHETTSRQIARLKKSAYIWAGLQDDIMTYFPGKDIEEKSELYANEDYLTQVTGQGGDYQARSSGFMVSYLFKRDLWESKAEWRTFYDELATLCKKGIPPQNRLDIWCEMSRVIYFIKLTEEQGLSEAQRQGTGMNRSAGLTRDDEIPIRSRKVYEILKEDSQKNASIFYQNLEDDIRDLRASFGVSKLPYEHNIRHICRAFIYWAKIFSDPTKDQRSQYFVTYSRTVATLCYGFLVCQTCSFVEGNAGVEEHQIFWLLISLVTYILSSYFETNEKSAAVDTLTFKQREDLSRRRNTLVNSALRCSQVKGIKSDLLLLKVLLKDYQPEIYEKFEELGLPLEYYFGDYMLSLFFNLFNPGLTFRIWDVLFFEGSSANQVKCNRMIVCVIYTLLQECKQQILHAREGADIKFVIEMYARFQTSYGDFLRKCYQVCKDRFEQTVPNSDTVLGKLSLIKYAFFSDEYNKIDNQTQKIEKVIEGHFEQILAQNVELYKFGRKEYEYRAGADPEILSYPILSQMIHGIAGAYGNPINAASQQNIQAQQGDRKLLREQPSSIWVKVYSLTSPIEDVRKTALNIVYGSQTLTKKDYNPLSVNLEGNFGTRELAGREIKVEILDERDPYNPKKIKSATIDLKTIPVNVITKLNVRLNEEDPNIYSENFVVSEVEIAILVETAPEPEAHLKAARKEAQSLLLRDLEDIYYNDFKIQNIQNSIASEIKAHEGLDDNVLTQFSVLKRSQAAWKENFVLTADEFASIMRNAAPFWSESDIRNIHRSITRASRNSVFYLSDFFTLLILYVKGTLNQKYGLLFELFTSFDASRPSRTPEISLHDLKGLACHLYDVFMIHIPYNQLENMVDLAATGHATCIKQVIINEQIEGAKVEYPRQALNKISNFVHLNTYSKDIPVQTAEILKFLRKIYENEILPNEEGRRSWLAQNTIDIIYFTDGRNHRMTLYVDQNWKPQQEQAHQHEQAVLRLLDCYRNVLPLTTPSSLYTKEQFVKILQKLPLMNYLCSFENAESTQTYMLLNEIKFTVLMENEPLIAVKPNYNPAPKVDLSQPGAKKKEKFATLLRNWPTITRQVGTKPSSPSRSGKQDVVTVPAQKLDAFLPLSKIIENIKRTVVRNIIDNYNNKGKLDAFQSKLYNEHFYTLDYDITIVLNKSQRFINIDPNYTAFLAIMDLIEVGPASNSTQNLEIVFSLKSSRIPDTYRDQYNQLAVYRHSDGSSEWLPCKIEYKFQFGQVDANIDSTVIDGFGVTFERFPGETFIKKASEVIISQQIDMDELLLKRVDKTTWRAITVDQIARQMDKSSTFSRANEPGQRSQQQGAPINNYQFDDPLNRNAQTSQKSTY